MFRILDDHELKVTRAKPNSNQKTLFKNILTARIPYVFENRNTLDLLISNHTGIHSSKQINFKFSGAKFPFGSFVKFKNNIYISSPELLFFQLASVLNETKLFLLGLEFCGKYSISKDSPNGFVTNINPLTTPEKINNYLKLLSKENKYLPYMSIAKKVAKELKSNSASPQESRLFIKLCLPRKYGSYGARGFVFNKQIKLSQRSYDILGQTTIKPDLVNGTTKVAIEYDSSAFHDNADQNTKDKLRWDAMHNDGWKLFNFIPAQMKDVYKFDAMAKSILLANKQDCRIKTNNFISKRKKLWTTL